MKTPLLAQLVMNSSADLVTIVNWIIGIIVILACLYALVTYLQGIMTDRGDGGWKHGLLRAVLIMLASPFIGLLASHIIGQHLGASFN